MRCSDAREVPPVFCVRVWCFQAAIVENIRLYTDKYDEEFAPHLQRFTQGIWGLLMKVWI